MNKNTETKAFIKGSKYVDLINTCLDRINFYNLEDFANVIAELEKFQKLKSKKSISLSEDITQYKSINDLYELFADPEINVAEGDIEDFKEFFLFRVEKFKTELEQLTLNLQQEKIKEQEMLREQIEKRRLANQELQKHAANKSKVVDSQTRQLMEQYQVALTTLPKEAKVCIQLQQIIEMLDNHPARKSFTQDERTKLTDLTSETLGMISPDLFAGSKISFDKLNEFKETLHACFLMFNGSNVTLEDFQTQLSLEVQAFLIGEPDIIYNLRFMPEREIFFFLVKMLYLVSWGNSVINAKNPSEVDPDLKNSLVTHYIETCQEYLNITYDKNELIFADTVKNATKMAEISYEVLIPFAISLDTFAKRDLFLFDQLMIHGKPIRTLIENSGVSLGDILSLPDSLVLNLINKADQIYNFIKTTGVGLKDLIAVKQSSLEILFNSEMNLQRTTVLLNYFHLNFAEISNLDVADFEHLLAHTYAAIKIFNKDNKPFSAQDLQQAFNASLANLESHAKILADGKHIIKIKDILTLPKTLLTKLRGAGVNFYAAKEIYELQIGLNEAYILKCIDKFSGKYLSSSKKLSFEPKRILHLFSPANQTVVFNFFERYLSILQNNTPRRRISFKYALNTKLPAECMPIPTDYISRYSTIGDNELCGAIVRHEYKRVSELIPQLPILGFNCKGISYYSLAVHVGASKIASAIKKQAMLDMNNVCNSFIQTHLFQPKDLNKANAAGNLPLNLATQENLLPLTEYLMLNGANAFVSDKSNSSAFDIAMKNGNDEIIPEMLSFEYKDQRHGFPRLRMY